MDFHIFTLVFLVHLTVGVEYRDLIDPFVISINPCDSIRNGQFICKDCSTLAFCTQQDGSWTTLDITECDTEHNMYCDEKTHGCVLQESCRLPNRGPRFECQNAGIFPDPYDCKYYHVCNDNNIGERFVCPKGTAYSPGSKTCSLSINSNICFEPQYNCTKFGEMGAWPTDPTIFYVCHVTSIGSKQVRYPLLYRCSLGNIFINNKCVPNTQITTTPLPIFTPEIDTCIPESGLSPNPYDCHSYFICINGKLVSTNCPFGTYFNNATKSCAFGKC